MMFRIFRWLFRSLCLLPILFFIYINIQLYNAAECPSAASDSDLFCQLHFLKEKLHDGKSAEAMQSIYPEGFMFIHALYALAWCDASVNLSPNQLLYTEALEEVGYALEKMDSPEGKQIFNPNLPLEYGAYYRGWTAYARGRYWLLGSRDSLIFRAFQKDCQAIAQAIEATEKSYLESYNGLCWPADNVVCLAALALHDRVTTPRYSEVRTRWLARIKSTLTLDSQLIPHSFDLGQNRPLEGARGSSQSLILTFLPEIDSMFSVQQYQYFRTYFLAERLGLPGIREYPQGVSGKGDIDSGPVLMGIGGAASIVAVKATALHRDWSLSAALKGGTGALLFPQNDGTKKRYLLGKLPILDAFIAWSNAGSCSQKPEDQGNWRWKFQLFSISLILLLGWAFRKTWMV